MLCKGSYHTIHRGSTVFPKTEVCRVKPSKSHQMRSQHFIPGRPAGNSTAECFRATECLCVHTLAGSAQQPANQTPRTCLNGWIKLLGPETADCVFFLLGARNSIIEVEQEAWCSREATRSTCACQCAKVNMQPTAHHASALAYRRRALWLDKW